MLSSLAEAIKLCSVQQSKLFAPIRQPWRFIVCVSLKRCCIWTKKYRYINSCSLFLTFIVLMRVTIMSLIKHGIVETVKLKFISNMQHEIHTHTHTHSTL